MNLDRVGTPGTLSLTESDVAPPALHPSVAPHPDAPIEEDQATRRWALLSATHPELEARLAHLVTPHEKLLHVVLDRALSRQTGLTAVRIGERDSIHRAADGSLILFGQGAPTRLHDRHGDFAALIAGAGELGAVLRHGDLDAVLSTAVHQFHERARFDGGGAAANTRGGEAFTFATIQQVLASDDPSQRGLECLASAAVHQWKSHGLVPPWLTREEFEARFTSIHGHRGVGPRIDASFNKSLRGIPGGRVLDAAAVAGFANELRHDDWAKLTGAASGRWAVRTLSGPEALARHFERGGGAVRSAWSDGGHYFVLTGTWREGEGWWVNEDDSLRRAPARRTSSDERPYATPFSEAAHTRFWTLRRR